MRKSRAVSVHSEFKDSLDYIKLKKKKERKNGRKKKEIESQEKIPVYQSHFLNVYNFRLHCITEVSCAGWNRNGLLGACV